MEKDLKLRTEGFKREVRGFRVTHRQLNDVDAKKCFKDLKYICDVNPTKAFLEYKHFQRASAEFELKSITDRLVWMLNEGEFEELEKVYVCALSLPLSNAEVERGFSLMNNVKTDRRNRLLNDILFACMLLGKYQDFEFDFARIGVEIAELWR